MHSRLAVTGIVAAVAWIAPLSGVAHAQDLDCRDFAFQEDAQAFFNQFPAILIGSMRTRAPTTKSPARHCNAVALPLAHKR